MKPSELRSLIKEAIAEVLAEKPQGSEVEVESDTSVLITGIELSDGRKVSARFSMDGHIEDDGIGSYEFWGQKGYHKGNKYWVVDGYAVQQAWDDTTGQEINVRDQSAIPMLDEMNDEFERHKEEIEQTINQNA